MLLHPPQTLSEPHSLSEACNLPTLASLISLGWGTLPSSVLSGHSACMRSGAVLVWDDLWWLFMCLRPLRLTSQDAALKVIPVCLCRQFVFYKCLPGAQLMATFAGRPVHLDCEPNLSLWSYLHDSLSKREFHSRAGPEQWRSLLRNTEPSIIGAGMEDGVFKIWGI